MIAFQHLIGFLNVRLDSGTNAPLCKDLRMSGERQYSAWKLASVRSKRKKKEPLRIHQKSDPIVDCTGKCLFVYKYMYVKLLT